MSRRELRQARRSARRRAVAVAVALGVLLAALVTLYFVLRDSPPPRPAASLAVPSVD